MSRSPTPAFQLLAFHRDIAQSRALVGGGVDGLILDFERRGKQARQAGFDTQINHHQHDDITTLRNEVGGHLLCRINGPGPDMEQEIDTVLERGVDEIIVPMIAELNDAERAVRQIGSDAAVTLMIETQQAVALAPALGSLPVKRVYVGLNDLHISRGTASIFAPFADGVLDQVRAAISGPQFGVAGLTLPGCGDPVPVELLFGELARIAADFTFLRRSFYRDACDRDLAEALVLVRQAMAQAHHRTPSEAARQRDELVRKVTEMERARP